MPETSLFEQKWAGCPKPLVTEVPRPASLLLVGNSFFFFNNGICRWIRKLLAGATSPAKLRTNMAAINGASLSWHDVESYFRPGAISSYRFSPENEVIFRDPSEKLWDAVILLDSSQGPIHPTLGPVFAETAAKDCEIARARGATPIFLATWGYADKPGMTAELARATVKVANDCKALVLPVGFAFEEAMKGRPGLDLLIEDRRHPKPEGTYLMAAVIIEALLGIDARSLAADAGVEPGLAAYLRETAHETLCAFYGR